MLPLVFLLSLMVAHMLESGRWYRLLPTSWVISDLEAGQGRAMMELQRRLQGSTFDGHNHARLVALALREQSAPKPGFAVYWLLDYLGQSELDGKLTEDQKKRFFDTTYQYSLRTRPVVAVGEKVPLEMSYRFRVPRMLRLEHEGIEKRIDDQVVQKGGGGGSASGAGAGGGSTSWHTIKTIGEHTAEVTERVRIYAVLPSGQGRKLRHEQMVRLHSHFKAVEAADSGIIKLLERDDLAKGVRKSVSVQHIHRSRESSGQVYLMVALRCDSPPVNVAFDVFLKSDREHRIGTLTQRPGEKSGSTYQVKAIAVGDPSKVDVILRSSVPAARRTPDMNEIWKGEIVLKDVVVLERKPDQ